MNGIEKIIGRIESDTRSQIDALGARTDEQVKSITEGYERVAQQAYFTTCSNGKRAAETQLSRMASADSLAAKKALLAEKQQLLDQTFGRALDKLCALPEQQQLDLLVKLAVEGSTTGREELVFSAPDRARYGKKVVIAANEALEKAGKTACLTLSELSRDIRGGLYVKNGNIENNCSFEMILRLLREQLAAETAKLLFE